MTVRSCDFDVFVGDLVDFLLLVDFVDLGGLVVFVRVFILVDVSVRVVIFVDVSKWTDGR